MQHKVIVVLICGPSIKVVQFYKIPFDVFVLFACTGLFTKWGINSKPFFGIFFKCFCQQLSARGPLLCKRFALYISSVYKCMGFVSAVYHQVHVLRRMDVNSCSFSSGISNLDKAICFANWDTASCNPGCCSDRMFAVPNYHR